MLGNLIKAIEEMIYCDIEKDARYVTWESMKDKISDGNDVGLMDGANVVMIVPMNNYSYDILFTNFGNHFGAWYKSPNLDYDSNFKGTSMSIYSIEYIQKICNIINSFGTESTRIYNRKDYPITLEAIGLNLHFKFILAPRVDNDTTDEWEDIE